MSDFCLSKITVSQVVSFAYVWLQIHTDRKPHFLIVSTRSWQLYHISVVLEALLI